VKLSKARLEPIPETQWSDKVKETLREIKVRRRWLCHLTPSSRRAYARDFRSA
jgi:hypothetical protein